MVSEISGFTITNYYNTAQPPPELENVIELPYFTVTGIEGMPFASVEIKPVTKDWEGFGQCLNDLWAKMAAVPGSWFIDSEGDGVGLAMCMKAKEPIEETYPQDRQIWGPMQPYGEALFRCGQEHPEYLPPIYLKPAEQVAGGISNPEGLTYWEWIAQVYFPGQTTLCEICGEPLGFVGGCPIGETEILTATLAEPIAMDALRGITVNCIYNFPGNLSGIAYLRFIPTFPTEMGPTAAPAFRGSWSFTSAQTDKEVCIAINTLFARGYYYPGLYEAEIDLGTGKKFVVKNVAQVTGTGVV